MDCDKYKELIQEFHDGELPRQSEAFLFTHLSSCEECREFLKLLNQSSMAIKQETSSYPFFLDERILRSAASYKPKSYFLTGRVPAYVVYALTFVLIGFLLITYNSVYRQKDELRGMLDVLNQQNSIVKEQNKQLQMLMNELPETQVTSELESKIIINAKL